MSGLVRIWPPAPHILSRSTLTVPPRRTLAAAGGASGPVYNLAAAAAGTLAARELRTELRRQRYSTLTVSTKLAGVRPALSSRANPLSAAARGAISAAATLSESCRPPLALNLGRPRRKTAAAPRRSDSLPP
eukprot:170632-Hanusia_phi.AAC.2